MFAYDFIVGTLATTSREGQVPVPLTHASWVWCHASSS